MPDNKTNIDPDKVKGLASAKQAIVLLCNMVEGQAARIKSLIADNQKLRDENNRLKGEQGKPDIKGKNQKSDISKLS